MSQEQMDEAQLAELEQLEQLIAQEDEEATIEPTQAPAEEVLLATQPAADEDVDAVLAGLVAEQEAGEPGSTQPAAPEEQALPACEDPPATQAAQAAAHDPADPAPSVQPAKPSGSSAATPAPPSGPKKPAFAKPALGGARKPQQVIKSLPAAHKPSGPSASAAPAAPAAKAAPAKPSAPAAAPAAELAAPAAKPEAPAQPKKAKLTARAPPAAKPAPAPSGKENAAPAEAAAAPAKAPAAPKVAKAKPPGGKPAATGGAGAGGDEAKAAKDKGPKRAISAFLFFCTAKRGELKLAEPSLTPKDITARLGELWRGLESEERQPFEALAAADKERYQREKAELEATGGGSGAGGASSDSTATAAAPKPKRPPVKTAYQLFFDEKRTEIEAANPKAAKNEIHRLMAQAWKEADQEPYKAQRAELLATLPKPKTGSEVVGSKRKAGGGGGKGKRARKDEAALDAEVAAMAECIEAADESDDEDTRERLSCDWEAHPADGILSATRDGKYYLVARRGLGLGAYGLVEQAAAKAARLGGASSSAAAAAPCPLPLEQVEEFERWQKEWGRAVHASTQDGFLDLEGLPEGSPLEACLYLGQLRSRGHPLERVPRDDIAMKVPMLAMCAIMQRCLALERGRARGLAAELEAERSRVAELEVLLLQAAGGEVEADEGEDAAMQVQGPAAGGKTGAAAPTELAAAEV